MAGPLTVPVDLQALADDLRVETATLDALLAGARGDVWGTATPAEGWTVHDQVTHLAFFDDATTTAATDPDGFRAGRGEVLADVDGFTEQIADRYRQMPGPEVHAWLHTARAAMLLALELLDPSTRLPWYGPDLSVAGAITARIMETWAHGQDIADGVGVTRRPTRALWQVAHLGTRALPNSFLARGRPVPDSPVRVELVGPGGETRVWGPDDAPDVVHGPALDFCLVVTQRRHLDDVALEVRGPIATEWMGIAQAFAGPPGPGRAPGQFDPASGTPPDLPDTPSA
jgi:uncharacterized protein (TIGR03084 family)